jgi:predicted transglutaminase-like cysteine proteinase
MRSALPRSVAYDYFAQPASDDAWSPKISGWQERERSRSDVAVSGSPASVSGSGSPSAPGAPTTPDLRTKLERFRADQRRATAREIASWIQLQARQHYVPDGPVDHWATLRETLARGSEDCDGLELLVNDLLRELGFSADEVFRAIVYRPADGQHHMVTLWFEDQNDPWVIDPTGAMTTGMPRMSELRDWVPLKVFSETSEFTVREASVER